MVTHLLSGNDESVLRSAVHELVDELVADGDRAMMVDEFDGDEYELRMVVDAAQTPAFLTDKRVVVARGVDRFNSDELTPLIAYLETPLDTSDLVIVINSGSVPKKLGDAVKRVGAVTNTSPPSRAKDRQAWISDHIADAGLRIKPDAAAQLGAWLGEDAGRLDGILATLTSTYGSDHVLAYGDIEPFLGDAGGVPPWDFTDAIDAGDTTKALTLLGRMMHGGSRHPLQIMAILHSHYANIARLDGADSRS
jgi:DNA polymerase-3 subunit delta